ncbi:unnamed protein product [Merluccius merluccius]
MRVPRNDGNPQRRLSWAPECSRSGAGTPGQLRVLELRGGSGTPGQLRVLELRGGSGTPAAHRRVKG